MKQAQALDIFKTGQNIFLTGAAGSGKTYILNQYIKYLREKNLNVSVTATTGIAATHLNGLTIHSWSGLGVKDDLRGSDFDDLLKKRHLRRNILGTDVLIIDEISMLHAHQLDLVNQICQAFRQNLKPFGGLQLIMAGDFFQLPPIAKGEERAKIVVESDIWNAMDLAVCYLDEQYRQADSRFIQILNEIRKNNVSLESRELLLNRFHRPLAYQIEPTKLYTHNIDVDAINSLELEKISGPAKSYQMQSKGNQVLSQILQKGCLAPERLVLKIGAKVMFVKNNFELGVVNGTVGEVVDFDEDNYPIVKTSHGETVVAAPADWLIEEDGRVRAEIRQIPLRLAWAITVHKSQGLSLDLAEVDLSKAFVPGMGYVALSRVRSLQGLRLVGLNDLALTVDANILALDEKFIALSKQTENYWQSLSTEEQLARHQLFARETSLKPRKSKKVAGRNKEKTKALIAQKMSLPAIAQELGFALGTIIRHIENLLAAGEKIDIDYLLPGESERQEITAAFADLGMDYLAPVFEYLNGIYSFETLRLVRAWLMTKR
ncbi:MAG TPA: AAA family ATPase [Patescibacteria group bacterium]|nr:AAA family ATPase [Patescibacteria group bacterium]